MITYPNPGSMHAAMEQQKFEAQIRQAQELSSMSEMGKARETENAEQHELVTLMLARMESNPDEFGPFHSKWLRIFENCKTCMTEDERSAIYAKLGKVRLDAAHVQMMKELLNPTDDKVNADIYSAAKAQLHKYQMQQALSGGQAQNLGVAQQNALGNAGLANAAQQSNITGPTHKGSL